MPPSDPTQPSAPPLLPRVRAWFRIEFPRIVRAGLIDFREYGLRWSYIILVPLILLGAVVNALVPHGWTVWPFVAVIAILLYLHEAADRNGQGVPPLKVYAWFGGVMAIWIGVTLLLSTLNPLIAFAGLAAIVYHAVKSYLKDRERRLLIETRRAEGRCITCGELADPHLGVCMNCGEEPDPLASQTARVQAVVKNRKGGTRTREVLQQQSLSAAARKKEAALLKNSPMRAKSKRK